ncbi:MAG TPA: hypothetical protein VEA79_11285 [Phenylobacterium sp.]|nr:hypothetical protein [Phenylobacterium sp.]
MKFEPTKNLQASVTAFCLLLLADAIRWAHPHAEALSGLSLYIGIFLHALIATYTVLELRHSTVERARID